MNNSIPDSRPPKGQPPRRPNLVQFDVGSWRFSAPLVPILCAVLVVPLLVSLGFWQLDRASQREHLLVAADRAQHQDALPVEDPKLLEATPRYLPVSLRGRADARRQFLLDNRVHGKVAGYEVLLPIIYKPGKAVLINRGWLPVGASRDVKPDVSLPLDSDQLIDLEGIAVIPPERFVLGESTGGDEVWPRVLQYEDFDMISDLLDLDVLPRIVQPGELEWGFKSIWSPVQKGPEQNYAYALQWFALAITLVLIVLVLCVRRRVEKT